MSYRTLEFCGLGGYLQSMQRRPRLLLVDDELPLLRALRRLLTARFEVEVAASAEEALALIELRHYHAVITDFELPGKSGVWLLDAVKTRQPGARRILTSGRPASSLPESASSVAEKFVPKPATSEELIAALI